MSFSKNICRRTFLAVVAATSACWLAGCVGSLPWFSRGPEGGSPEAWSAISNGAPVRVAVFVDSGARGVGMFRWMQLMDQSPDVAATPIDGAAIRAGALRRADVLVMPGGMSNLESDSLGAEGKAELRRFIQEGGSYLGTCAGAFLMMTPSTNVAKAVGMSIAPYSNRRGGHFGGEGMLEHVFTQEAESLSGIKKGAHMIRFNGGPVMEAREQGELQKFQTLATFNANMHTDKAGPGLASMAGGAAVVAGTYGKGRVWLFAGHPEYYPRTWDTVTGAFKYLTGRAVKLIVPQRLKGQLAVAWWCKPSPGVESAKTALELVRDPDFDVVPYANDEISRTDLRHVDALVLPDVPDASALKALSATSAIGRRVRDYVARGGTVVAWGNAAAKLDDIREKIVVVGSGSRAIRALRSLNSRPTPAPRGPVAAKRDNPVRAGIYTAGGANGCAFMRWIKLLSLSPDCELTLLDDADVRAGALKDIDLYIAPGGSSATQASLLGPNGRTNLVEFVRAGGGYFGTCAGCYLALSQADEKPIRLGMLPWKRQKCPYRGGAELSIKFTENATMFGIKPKSLRSVRYHGGPVLLASEQIPGSDVRTIATYNCDGVYSYNTNAAPTMAGTPALVAGTFGKGRIVGCSPHPESYTHTQDIIRGGLKYITGRAFDSVYPQRTRGNLSVCFFARHLGKNGATLVKALYREPAYDLRAVDGETCGGGELEHCDVLMVANPVKDDFSRHVKTYLLNGGKMIVFGDEKHLANVPEDLKTVVKCKNGDEAAKALAACK